MRGTLTIEKGIFTLFNDEYNATFVRMTTSEGNITWWELDGDDLVNQWQNFDQLEFDFMGGM
jgi:ribosomal protein S11